MISYTRFVKKETVMCRVKILFLLRARFNKITTFPYQHGLDHQKMHIGPSNPVLRSGHLIRSVDPVRWTCPFHNEA